MVHSAQFMAANGIQAAVGAQFDQGQRLPQGPGQIGLQISQLLGPAAWNTKGRGQGNGIHGLGHGKQPLKIHHVGGLDPNR